MITTALALILLLIEPSISGGPSKSKGCGDNAVDFDLTGGSKIVYQYDGDDETNARNFTVLLPNGYDHNKKTPLVMVLPGFLTSTQMFSGVEEGDDDFELETNIHKETYIAVVLEGTNFRPNGEKLWGWNDKTSSASPGCDVSDPDCIAVPTCDPEGIYNEILWNGKNRCYDGDACNWNDCRQDDILFIDDITDLIEDNFCIDTQREYITGFSNGGQMTQTIACERSSRFAAAAAINGQRHLGYNCAPSDYPGSKPMPFMNIWNTYDNIIPGEVEVARNSWYYTAVQEVQDRFAESNNCDLDQMDPYITTATGEHENWKNFACYGYLTGCDNDAKVIQCEWGIDPKCERCAAGHTPPISTNPTTEEKRNRGLEVIYEFFKNYKRT